MFELLSSSSALLIILVSLINLVAFIAIGLDKNWSMQSGANRTPEINFFLWASFFGSVGVLFGMLFFRHKTQKLKFILGISVILLQQISLLYLILIILK